MITSRRPGGETSVSQGQPGLLRIVVEHHDGIARDILEVPSETPILFKRSWVTVTM
jgi:hypothetical protein